jgi:DNA-binding GntR family transcriptional regulator
MKNQSELAYKRLREKILSGSILPGNRLVEQMLSEEIGVNRGDVRQALSRLCAEGLASKGEKGGYFVKILSEKDVEELYELRYILETTAVPLILERAKEEDYRELETIVEHMELMAKNEYMLGVYEADLRFHTALIQAAHNDKLFDVYVRANIPLSGIHGLRQNVKRIGRDHLEGIQEHRRIVECLRAKDVEQVVLLIGSAYHRV